MRANLGSQVWRKTDSVSSLESSSEKSWESSQPEGRSRSPLGSSQLRSPENPESGWWTAVDEVGQVYMRLGSLELPHDHAQPVWLPLDSEREVE